MVIPSIVNAPFLSQLLYSEKDCSIFSLEEIPIPVANLLHLCCSWMKDGMETTPDDWLRILVLSSVWRASVIFSHLACLPSLGNTVQLFPDGSTDKMSACDSGDLGLILMLGRSPGERNGYPFWYSGLETSMDRGTWQAVVHGVAKSQTWLSDFHFHPHISVNCLPWATFWFMALGILRTVKRDGKCMITMLELWGESLSLDHQMLWGGHPWT